MSLRSKRIVGLALGSLVTVSAAVAPAAAQGISVIAPTHPTVARWFGLQTGSEFVLGATRRQIQIADFQEPRRVRLCVTSGASHVAARAVTEDGEIVVPVGHCRDIQAARIYEFDDGTRIGARFAHISNAGIHDDNPGEEELFITFAIPFR